MLSIASDGIQETEVTELSYRITSCSLPRPAPARGVPCLFAPPQPPLAWMPAPPPAERYLHPWVQRPGRQPGRPPACAGDRPGFLLLKCWPAISSRSAGRVGRLGGHGVRQGRAVGRGDGDRLRR